MDNSLREALEYFRAGSNNLWKWSDDLQVIEWQSGETICYRKELMEILWSMQPAGLPEYLDAIILILASCKTNWNSGVYLKNIPFLKNEEVAKYYSEPDVVVRSSESTIFTIPDKMRELVPIFETIQALPYELKAETPKQHLLYEIFNRVHPRINALKSKTFLQTFEAGIIDSEIKFKNKHILTYERTWRMLNISGLNVKNLEYRLRTGLEKAPDSLPIPLPDPIPQTDDLLTQLTQDPQTAGLARLAKRLIAALNIPPHTRGASDQPLGGVSDISNRGNYDRLLLSELANDDDTLSARLVNNEALYLRRETPPDPQVQERMILVDVSLRLWGMPRVFATAAALGCALNNPQKAKITAFALGQEVSEPNALSNKEDVLHFLEKLSPALHPGEALKDFLRQNIISIHQSVFFITSEDVMADKNFALLLAEWIVHLNYLLVLNRSGELWMYKVVNGRRSLLTTTKFDLEEVLFGPSKKEALAGLMQTLSLKKATFDDGKTRTFLPTHPGRLAYPNLAFKEDILVAVLPCRRVWFWHGQTKGAIELLETIEEGRYSFHLNEQGVECIMVVTKDYAYFAYLFQQNTLAIQVDFGKKNIHYFSQEAATVPLAFEGRFEACSFVEGKLNFSVSKVNERGFNERTFVALDPGSNTLTPLAESPPFNLQWYRYRSLNPIKSIVNNGYSVLRNVKIFGISHEAYFNLDGFAMMLHEHQLWLKKANQSIHSKKPFLNWRSLDAQFYTRTIEYPNGHKIALDSRGFLLLFNPNSQEADITITLILEKELAAWTHDGYFTGNPYFFNAPADRTVSPSIFYNKYILPFIRKIQ